MEDILQHPEIQALDDDNDGFWDDSKYYSFRQSYIDEEGDFIHARVEIMTPDETYYFYTLDNQSYVSRYYQPPNYYGSLDISFWMLDAGRLPNNISRVSNSLCPRKCQTKLGTN